MRFIIVLSLFFSACCCLPVLNLFLLDEIGGESNLFYIDGVTPLNNNRTDDDIIRCQNFTDKLVKDLDHKPTQEELQAILSECSLLLQQNTKLSAKKHYNIYNKLQQLENSSRLKYEFIPKMHSTAKSPEETNSINIGSSDNSSPVLVTGQNVSNSTDKFRSSKSESLKMDFDNGPPSPANMRWSFWSLLSSVKDSRGFSTGNRSSFFGNIERDPILEPGIDFETSTDLKPLTTEITSEWKIIMPGTKWCGPGTNAVNDDDLGFFENVDKCCRAHDNCDDMMATGESKYNLTNTSPFTVLNCKCDDELYDCLSQIDSITANAVGNTFFNVFGRRCYMLDHPRVCKKHSMLGCLEYEIDKTAEKIYQWKPAKKYLKMPFKISRK